MRYIDADKFRQKLVDRQITTQFFNPAERHEIGCIIDMLDTQPIADVVDTKAIEQIKWERDMAIKQLEYYGVGFGEQADVTKVKHGEWEYLGDKYVNCTVCGTIFEALPTAYAFEKDNIHCRHCGAKMDGKEPANENIHSK